MTLKALYNKHGCDKAKKHRYHEVYETHFALLREEPINILEIGVFKGDSMRAHLEYFSNAKVHGVDIFERVSMEDISMDWSRASIFKGSSLDPNMSGRIRKEFKNIKYDIIIDDGKHTPDANRITFQNFSRLLKKTGVYFIEDVWPLDIMTSKEKQHQWLRRYHTEYTDLQFDQFMLALKDYTVVRHDNRALTGEPDSYIMAITND
jgi:spermidine synthase